MSATLEFDIEKLRETKNKCDELASEIAELKDQLMTELDSLREGWKTPAGEKFFAEQDTDLEAQVASYVNITEAISKLLNVAIEKYTKVEEKAKNIKL